MSNKDVNDREELKVRLEDLHADLQSASEITASEREVLSNLVVGVLRLDSEKEPTEHHLREVLEEKSSAYEAQYPKLAFTMRQVLDILSRMGI
jgi:hypothetical protein|tara:strand:- start:2781 stop:3059 length:279 start_codon:yes stop_codon:yes gene_type:complete